jgi:Sulfotransferase family
MRNAIILGAGRSGTSLLAGLFHGNGYFSGDNLWRATASNPLGYFEDVEINSINEDLLDQVAPWRPRGIIGALTPFVRDRPRYSQRWLASLPAGTVIPSNLSLDGRMAAQTARRPYLFKDPRFSYTLPSWLPYLAGDTVFLCTFREPQRTVNSVMKIIREERYLRDLKISPEKAYEYWQAIYESVLRQRDTISGEWLFVHYDELLNGRSIPLLEERLQARADRTMMQSELARSTMDGPSVASADAVFQKLLVLAEQKYAAVNSVPEISQT